MTKIDREIFGYHAEDFPSVLRTSSSAVAGEMARAVDQASLALTKAQAFLEATVNDSKLSREGKIEKLKEWRDAHLAGMLEAAERVSGDAAKAEHTAIKAIVEEQVERPTEVADVEEAKEIRAWFRSLSDDQREDMARKLTAEGDHAFLRATLHAPSYLTGLSAEQVNELRNDAAKALNPDRYARVQTLRKGGDATRKAIVAAVSSIDAAFTDAAEFKPQARHEPPPINPENRAKVVEALRNGAQAEQLGFAS